jgi:putative NADPH-quinone reductase
LRPIKALKPAGAHRGRMKKILIINGHPDGSPERFCAALADAYADGASAAGHEVRRVRLADLKFPLIDSRAAFETGATPDDIRRVQDDILWCEHLVIVHPLWLGGQPALLKGLLEQVFRYGFALAKPGTAKGIGGLLGGRSARMIVTMGMPSPVYRLVFGAFGVRAVERGILAISGIRPIRRTLVGGVEGLSVHERNELLEKLSNFGRAGS